jgi:hypothetical protein
MSPSGYDDEGGWDEEVDPEDYSDAPSTREVREALQAVHDSRLRRRREEAGESGLEEFVVPWSQLGVPEVEAMRVTLEAATGEADLQAFLDDHPEVLVQTLGGGHGRWSISQQRLGAEFVTDFVIAEKSSIGFEWTAVELESPLSSVLNKRGDPSATLTQLALTQPRLRLPASHSGWSRCTDVDPQLPGLIIIGRRRDVDDATNDRRRALSREMRIQIRTYDWLVDVAARAADRHEQNS